MNSVLSASESLWETQATMMVMRLIVGLNVSSVITHIDNDERKETSLFMIRMIIAMSKKKRKRSNGASMTMKMTLRMTIYITCLGLHLGLNAKFS